LGVVHVIGQGAIAWALGRLPATTTSVMILVQLIVAALLGWVLFGEPIVPLQALFAAVVLTGAGLAQRSAAAQARMEDAAVGAHENGLGETPEPANLKA